MDNHSAFAVLVLRPNTPLPSIEAMAILASSPEQALLTAAKVCREREELDSKIIGVFSKDDVKKIEKMLSRAEFIGPQGGHVPPEVKKASKDE